MKKIVWFMVAFMLSLPAFATVAPEVDTPQNRRILKQVETLLDNITTLKSRFSEFSSKDGDFMKHGVFYLSRPNRMRLVYDEPTSLEFIADGQYLIYHDKSFDQVSYLEINQTPAAILLKPDFSFDDPEFLVTNVQEELDEYHVTAIKANEPELGQLTLIVTQDPLELKQWELVDMKGIKSTVGLYEVEENIPVDMSLFVFQK